MNSFNATHKSQDQQRYAGTIIHPQSKPQNNDCDNPAITIKCPSCKEVRAPFNAGTKIIEKGEQYSNMVRVASYTRHKTTCECGCQYIFRLVSNHVLN